MTYDVVMYDVVGPTISYHDVVGMTDIVGPDLRCRMLSSYAMSSVLTYDVVGFLHHVACDIACDVSFDSDSGVQMVGTGPEYSALHLQVLFL